MISVLRRQNFWNVSKSNKLWLFLFQYNLKQVYLDIWISFKRGVKETPYKTGVIATTSKDNGIKKSKQKRKQLLHHRRVDELLSTNIFYTYHAGFKPQAIFAYKVTLYKTAVETAVFFFQQSIIQVLIKCKEKWNNMIGLTWHLNVN